MFDPNIINDDCLAYMRTMPPDCVFVVVTSPPYNLGKQYSVHNDSMPEDTYLDWQGEVAKEIARVLRPDGHLFLNIGADSKHPWRDIDVALRYRKHLTLQNRPGWIKSLALDASALRTDPALHDTVHMRTFGHFVSLNSDYFLNPCLEPIYHFTPAGRSPINRTAEGVGVPYVFKDQPARFGHHRERHCRGTAWHVPYPTTQSRADRDHHPATFPVGLVELCLRLAAPRPNDLVLDPFAGTGSTLLAAQAMGLNVIGIEIDPAYCAAARRRLDAVKSE
jgi:site-specific DNA-methyltransferase (adenine-specific)